MSRENVEIVRRVYEAAANRDSATILALYDADVELEHRAPLEAASFRRSSEATHTGQFIQAQIDAASSRRRFDVA